MSFDDQFAVIFDEASQVKPADAINCIYRGRQLIVAGDPKQLPPTTFFDQLGSSTGDEYVEDDPENFESVLDGLRSSGLPTLPLRWHYRSQHESLITYSNYSFYEGQLLTFPSATDAAHDVGVEAISANGTYRRGGARDNPVEAQKVVERVLFHRRAHPELTLGVVAFSSAQESAIAAEIERQSDRHPELNQLLSTDRLDGFFVKNLENVQGDERDIIVFSIGYGPDENGRFTEQLGPLSQQGGERRLNVAVTRARRRVEVVSSVSANQFPGTSAAPGVRHLQRYLDYASRGVEALAIDVDQEGGDAESPFEAEVLRVVRELGYDAVSQLGVAGFRLDIAVRHPNRPGAFALGIECDGAAYHSSRVARDRDRLRQEVLEHLGWRIYRIWGPSWYRNRARAEAELRKAIEEAISDRRSLPKRPDQIPPAVEIESAVLDERPDWTETYRRAPWSSRPPLRGEFIDPGNRHIIIQAIVAIVEVESPIHNELLRQRVCWWYSIDRMGSRIRDAYDRAIAGAVRSRPIQRVDKDFLARPGSPVVVRVPSDSDSPRAVNHVAPPERREAIRHLVVDAHRIEYEELLVAFARLFGWRRAGNDIRIAFDRDVRTLAKQGAVISNGGTITPGAVPSGGNA